MAPGQLTEEYIAERWPRLFHMAEAGSWPSIRRHGLLSTSRLLDLYEIAGPERVALEAARRPRSVEIRHPVHGIARIRDNRPINETVLRRTLVGMSEAEWYRTLNRRVFFWISEKRLHRLRGAQYNRDQQHDLLIFDTARVLEARAADVELAHLNTGAVFRAATYPRGEGTFRSIATYPWNQRLRVARTEPIVELTVLDALPDVDRFLVDVTRC